MTAEHTTRWLIRRDIEAALELGAMVPWDQGDLLEHNKQRNAIAMVCEDSDQQIVGWLAYTLAMPHVGIVNIACDDWTAPAESLMQRLLNKMGDRRDLITVTVPDYQDDILCMFRACGFVVWHQTGDVIQMRYDLPIETELCRIDGVTCRRSTGFPCMVPEGM